MNFADPAPRHADAHHQGLPSLQSRLLLLLLLPSAFGAVVVTGILWHDYQQGLARSSHATLLTARALTVAVDNQLSQVQAGLSGLAASGTVPSGNLALFHEVATDYAASSADVTNIVLADPSGQQLVNTLRPFGSVLPNLGQDAPARIIIATERPFARIVPAGLTGKPIVVAGVPVRRKGAVVYALSASVPYEAFQRLFDRQQLPAGWVAAIVDDRGAIVARTVEPEVYRAKQVSPALAQALARGREGSFEGVTLEGIEVLTAFSRSPASGWSVAVGIPRHELAADLRRSLLALGAGVFAVLGMALFLSWRNGRRMAQALAQLLQMSVQLGRGERVPAPAFRFSEVDRLGMALSRAGEDLTEARRQTEEEQARMAAVLKSAMDGIVVADEQQRIVEFNPAACALFGYEREEVLGTPLSRLVPPDQREPHEAAVARFAASGGQPRLMGGEAPATRGVRRDGSEFPIEASIAAATVGQGQVLTVIVRDITQRLKVQEALLRSNEELQHYAAVASHDLRSPLRTIQGFLTVLERTSDGRLDERQRDLIARCVRAVKHMDRLTSDLLAYARLQRSPETFTDVNLEQVLGEVKMLLAEPLAECGGVIESGPLPTVRAASSELARLMENLVSNAIKYRGPAELRVRVTAQRRADHWVISVADNGVGVPEAFRERIFRLFERLSPDPKIPGTGIGLAICRRIVERHGGRLWVEENEGGGSVFRFTLPLGETNG